MATDPQALTISTISKAKAAQAFRACAGLDPDGQATPDTMAAAGHCYSITGPRGSVAVSVQGGRHAWVLAAAGGGGGMAGETLAVLEDWARKRGAVSLGFLTMRAGLARIATRRGYVASVRGNGIKLEKKL